MKLGTINLKRKLGQKEQKVKFFLPEKTYLALAFRRCVSSYNYIDLGLVVGISEVSIGGEKLGTRWYGRHLYRLPDYLSRKKNLTLQVKISTTVGNYLKSSVDNEVGQRWARNQQWHRMGMLGPVRLL